MKALSRARAGLRAKQEGDAFEERFARACAIADVACTRVPDGCKQVGQKKLIRVKSPWDFVVTMRGHTALLDTKTTGEAAFQHSKIDPHQVSEMMRHAVLGMKAGYVIWLREPDLVIFVSAQMLWRRLELYTRGSVRAGDVDAIELGPSGQIDLWTLFGYVTSSPRLR